MRLFLALELPAEVQAEIASAIEALGGDESPGGLPDARWVRPEGLHMTLLFLGDQQAERRSEIERTTTEVCRSVSPWMMRMIGGGTFPPRRPGRVAWIGAEAPPALGELQTALANAAGRAAGLEAKEVERRFHPHVTVARARSRWPFAACRRFAEAVDRPFGEPFEVSETVLFRSHLGRGGARYEALARFPFAPGARLS